MIEKLFNLIKNDRELENRFKENLGKREIYKALKDIVENSQNILLIIDEEKPEFKEVFDTYTDTWDKMVKLEILKQYDSQDQYILSLTPDFEEMGFVEPLVLESDKEKYTEAFHTKDIEKKIISIYEKIKEKVLRLDSKIKINPQKYYISLRKNRNFTLS